MILTKTRSPIESAFQELVITLSYSLASFVYVDHILFVESSWAITVVISKV